MEKYVWEHVKDPADPERCQAVHSNQQCQFKCVPGSQYCPRHGGNKAVVAGERKRAMMYKLRMFNERLEQFANTDKVKSLREEIAMLRVMLEEIWNNCDSTAKLIVMSPKIQNLVTSIEKVVSSADRLETRMGLYLDKASALNFAGQIINIIAGRIEDPDVVETISNDIIEALNALTEKK